MESMDNWDLDDITWIEPSSLVFEGDVEEQLAQAKIRNIEATTGGKCSITDIDPVGRVVVAPGKHDEHESLVATMHRIRIMLMSLLRMIQRHVQGFPTVPMRKRGLREPELWSMRSIRGVWNALTRVLFEYYSQLEHLGYHEEMWTMNEDDEPDTGVIISDSVLCGIVYDQISSDHEEQNFIFYPCCHWWRLAQFAKAISARVSELDRNFRDGLMPPMWQRTRV